MNLNETMDIPLFLLFTYNLSVFNKDKFLILVFKKSCKRTRKVNKEQRDV